MCGILVIGSTRKARACMCYVHPGASTVVGSINAFPLRSSGLH